MLVPYSGGMTNLSPIKHFLIFLILSGSCQSALHMGKVVLEYFHGITWKFQWETYGITFKTHGLTCQTYGITFKTTALHVKTTALHMKPIYILNLWNYSLNLWDYILNLWDYIQKLIELPLWDWYKKTCETCGITFKSHGITCESPC